MFVADEHDVLPLPFAKDKTKCLFTRWKLGWTKWFKYCLRAFLDLIDIYDS